MMSQSSPVVRVRCSLALLLLASILGACAASASEVKEFALDNGLKLLEASGRIPNAQEFAASEKGLFLFLGLVAFGSLWQLWNWMAGDGLAWYFQVLYIPAVAMESLLSCL